MTKILPTVPCSLLRIVVALFGSAFTLDTLAADYRSGYPNRYYYPDAYHGLHNDLRLRQDMKHLDDQMRQQQWQLEEQTRQQQEQTQLLRQQQSAQQRVTAMQACYYRFDGGMDVCDRLFDPASKKHTACIETVKEINPGCATPHQPPR